MAFLLKRITELFSNQIIIKVNMDFALICLTIRTYNHRKRNTYTAVILTTTNRMIAYVLRTY